MMPPEADAALGLRHILYRVAQLLPRAARDREAALAAPRRVLGAPAPLSRLPSRFLRQSWLPLCTPNRLAAQCTLETNRLGYPRLSTPINA